MQAVYELSTARPHTPAGRRYSRAEWSVYCEGYYQALAAALRVLQWRRRLEESHAMPDRQPPLVIAPRAVNARPSAPAEAPTERPSIWLTVFTVMAAIAMLEVLALLAALIYRLV